MKKMIIAIMIIVVCGCGGGTSGSASSGGSVDKRLFGELRDPRDRPLANATVELPSVDASTTTDAQGRFSLTATVPVGVNEVIVTDATGRRFMTKVIVAAEPGDTELELVFSDTAVKRYGEWQITGRVEGQGCNGAFYALLSGTSEEDQRVDEILQTSFVSLSEYENVAPGIECRILVEVQRDGVPVSSFSYKVKALRCSSGEIEVVSEGNADTAGRVSIPFTPSTPGVCVYEVLIPEYGDLELGGGVAVSTRYAVF